MLATAGIEKPALIGLRRWNLGLTILHAIQLVAILLLASDFAITVTSQFPQGQPGSATPSPEALFEVRVGFAIAVFLGLAALDHLLTATALRKRYETDLGKGINKFRWMEYSVSATIMLVLIGFYTGITGITEVILIIGANLAMILFGWLQELMNPLGRSKTTMLPFWFGCIAGFTAWVAILTNLIGAAGSTTSQIPGFVFGIIISLFVFFMSFGLNQWLQYRQIGRWANYLYGEKVYLVLSLVAKSALAWQIFGGSLAL